MLHLDRLDLPRANSKILHFAPERGLANCLNNASAGYRPVDISPQSYKGLDVEKFDICTDVINLDTESVDLVIHNHVLEHIFCDVTAVILHLHRALTPGGYHIFSIPIHPRLRFDEYLGPLSREDAEKRFGQHDHCRQYGLLDLYAKFSMVFRPALEDFALGKQFSDDQLRMANIPETLWRSLNGTTVFAMRKEDVHFSQAAILPTA